MAAAEGRRGGGAAGNNLHGSSCNVHLAITWFHCVQLE